jgi:hypothetical protein
MTEHETDILINIGAVLVALAIGAMVWYYFIGG